MEDTVCRMILADKVLGMKRLGLGIDVQRVGGVPNVQNNLGISKFLLSAPIIPGACRGRRFPLLKTLLIKFFFLSLPTRFVGT